MEYIIKGIPPGDEKYGVRVIADGITSKEIAESRVDCFMAMGYTKIRLEEFEMPTASEVKQAFKKAVTIFK